MDFRPWAGGLRRRRMRPWPPSISPPLTCPCPPAHSRRWLTPDGDFSRWRMHSRDGTPTSGSPGRPRPSWTPWSTASAGSPTSPPRAAPSTTDARLLRSPAVILTLRERRLPMVGRARLYVCGITPYDTTHLGHAATFVWTDVLARVLHAGGLEVTVVRNVTDVDDDMLDQARAQRVPWRSLATRQTYRFEDDMRLLGVAHPAFEPRSHDYAAEVIDLAAGLLDAGAAYVAEGTVWFRGADVPAALGLSGAEALERARTGGHRDLPGLAEPFDVPVWQRSEEWEPSWPTPGGQGRPGWHAECTAMSLATVGSGLDVHAGGADLAF